MAITVQRAVLLVAALSLVLVAPTAAANGRFPRAQRLIQDPANLDVIALYGTYGLLVTRDAGATWQHVCEGATGVYTGEDPLLEIMDGGRLVLRTEGGLVRSDSSGCSYDPVLGSAETALQDITRDSAAPNGLVALSAAVGDDGVFASSLSISADGGQTFSPLGNVPPDLLRLGLTLDVAPNRPDLIYISGFDGLGRGTLVTSTDRGQTFAALEIDGLGIAAPPYIAAVSASDERRVFVRTDEFQRSNGEFEARETANDALVFTPDGGETWHRVLNKHGKLFGFALSPDERWVLAGYGDPALPATFVVDDELGLYRVAMADLVAAPDAAPWQRIFAQSVTCLRWTEHGLFACVPQDRNGFEAGRAVDASFSLADAAPFEPLLRLPEVRPLQCPAASDGASCLLETDNGWRSTCEVLRASCSLSPDQSDPDDPDGSGQAPQDPGQGAATRGPTEDSTEPSTPSVASTSGAMGAGSAAESAVNADSNAEESGSGRDGTGPSRDAAPPGGSGSCAAATHSRELEGAASAGWLLALGLLAARRRGLRQAALLAGAWSLCACSQPLDSQPPDPQPLDEAQLAGNADRSERSARDAGLTVARQVDCGGDGEEFALGMLKTAPGGELNVAIVAADPAPPLAGFNSWTVMLTSDSGEAIPAAEVTLTGWMPEHRHGLNSVPLTEELDGGRYQIQPINLFMPQLWEISLSVRLSDERQVVTFAFCIP